MPAHSRSKTALIALLSLVLFASGCSARWISVALADLPVLVQMALNVGTVVTTLESGKQLSPGETAAIRNISNEASKDLNLLQSLYQQYKATPSASTIQKIQSAIADMNQNLSALLQAAHINDATLSARITAAVNLILTTVNSFATLLPQVATPAQTQAVQVKAIPHAGDLKRQWNQQVCGPSASTALILPLTSCSVK